MYYIYYAYLQHNVIFFRGIAELPENDFGQGFDSEFGSSYPSPKLILGHGKSVNITAQALSDWSGKDSTYLSLKSGDVVEVTENQVCANSVSDSLF